MAKSVKLADIAKELGVSTVTVSNALLGKKGVSDRMRELIWKKAREMGYVKSAILAEHQGTVEHFHIGVLISERYLDKKCSFYWQIYQNLAALISKYGHFSILEIISGNNELAQELPHMLPEEKIDGIIVIGEMKRDYLLNISHAADVPALSLGFYMRELGWDAVMTDDYLGMDAVTEYMICRGCRTLAFVGDIYCSENNLNRYMGFLRALIRNKMEMDSEWMFLDGGMSISDIAQCLAKQAPDGIVCVNDKTAEQLITAFQKMEICVPEDISVSGYENFCLDWKLHEQLTTYEVNAVTVAEDALSTLLSKMTGHNTRKSVVVIPGYLVERDSVK